MTTTDLPELEMRETRADLAPEPPDFLLWCESQAESLRRRAFNEIDFDNIAEEIEDLGRNQVRGCRSYLQQALLHMLKAQAWPLSPYAPSWRAEAVRFCQWAGDYFENSMRQKIDIQALYARAVATMPSAIDGQPPGPVPKECPVTLDALLAADGEALQAAFRAQDGLRS